MRTMLSTVLFVLVAACGGGGGDDTQNPDAPPGPPDAAPRVCSGMAYDKCQDTTGSTDCMAGMECRFFMGDAITECTPTCDASNPCPPDEHGNPITCNMMGRCKASPPNSCTLP